MKLQQSPDLSLEKPLWAAGLTLLAGLDEAGRGAWAGPVTAGAVILPAKASVLKQLTGVRDSKCMTPRQRMIWAEHIKEMALNWGVGFASNEEIDQIGIVPATRLAMQRALAHLSLKPMHLLLDAIQLPEEELPQTSLPKGDARSLSIAAASVIAKTQRDTCMVEFDRQFPAYGFARHKGYGTRYHQGSLQENGPCKIHRFSFAPLREWRISASKQPPK